MEKEKNKTGKIAVIIISILLIVVIIIGVLVLVKLNKNNAVSTISGDNNNIEENIQKDEKQSKVENNKTNASVVSFKQMDSNNSSLTDEQKKIAGFFDEDYFQIYSYEELVRYADMLKNINVNMYCQVNTILSSDNNTFEAVCQWAMANEDLWGGKAVLDNPIIIKGNKPSKMVVPEDNINIRGKLIGAETRDINGKSCYLPVIEVAEIGENTDWYDTETLRQISKIVFGNNVKFRTPTEDEMLKMTQNSFYNFQNKLYLIEFENQSNLNFKVFDIWQSELGLISYNGIYNQGIEKDYLNKKLYITPDLQKYIVFDYSKKDKYIYISIYDRNLNKLWSREISQVSQIVWDATNSNLTFVSDNDFYNINIETGEDIWNPIYVGKRNDIRIVENGYIMLNNDSDDTIMFLDKEGKIKNKIDLNLNEKEKIDSTAIQKIDDKYVILFTLLDDSSSYNYKWSSKYIIIDENGNKINESK